ncbi:hypothetical protein HRR83_008198 [Exophiala dermatitidis]|uniref:Uncharacterized protein n=2 Tax=Exophiala dermatitidis TaxID=5970 RepID=H6BSS3_EXODN|nr:uncharacterized protein HMPREF1120_02399 [Exophiala dermatitidis NIH/UT8656]KAJ4507962.1 hypothetical protein HRR74_007847 [Exophiala dermatitidis]EHY54227.1 hypothetical protein HMPREF1120_02399 [Exophiala dermatitidis NIH/UT8656]KAJ4513627.1 hypothetical protein HRR73_005785 [Exophiala dermatitidis]KAJ4535527.1 hypothetical protein HRR77_007846 [Exophiala dermatitidis]KAJ4544452.1 hypothetical protein HRR76_002511 [Exophiala dermatitidis]
MLSNSLPSDTTAEWAPTRGVYSASNMNNPTREEILDILSTAPPNELSSTNTLRRQAHDLIAASTTDASALPDTLVELLTQVIKPLFTNTKHPALTATGRKNLVSAQHPLGSSFTRQFSSSDDDREKPWKSTLFTVPLLRYILASYNHPSGEPGGPLEEKAKTTIESHFFLLVPPILNLIDDSDASYKAAGCSLLRMLCQVLVAVRSDMLKRTGLGDVFVDALRANFMLLPPLTPEEDSLAVLTELYPAFLALVDARFVNLNGETGVRKDISVSRSTPSPTPASAQKSAAAGGIREDVQMGTDVKPHRANADPPSGTTSTPIPSPTQIPRTEAEEVHIHNPTHSIAQSSNHTSTNSSQPQSKKTTIIPQDAGPEVQKEIHLRLSLLTLLYRHGILRSLHHLTSSASGSLGTTTSVPITTFLVNQICPVFRRLDIVSVKHLQSLVPMLRVSLMDPFLLTSTTTEKDASLSLPLAVLDVLDCIVALCTPRIRDRWYPEILRGVVACWLNCVDDVLLETTGSGDKSKSKSVGAVAGADATQHLKTVMDRLKSLVRLLGSGQVVPKAEWESVRNRLVGEEKDLEALFGSS